MLEKGGLPSLGSHYFGVKGLGSSGGIAKVQRSFNSPLSSEQGQIAIIRMVAENEAQKANTVQGLYEAAKRGFRDAGTGKEPSPQDLVEIVSALERVSLDDLKLRPPSPSTAGESFTGGAQANGGSSGATYRPGSGAHGWSPAEAPSSAAPKPITYLHIHESANFVIGVFCLPAGAVIPLHNHPQMTVVSRVLYGTMRIQSYDWADPDTYKLPQTEGVVRPAYMVSDEVIHAPNDRPSVLFPECGNIHSFRALTDCAVLDVLSPPYRPHQGRGCTYYRDRASGDGAPPGPSTPALSGETSPLPPDAPPRPTSGNGASLGVPQGAGTDGDGDGSRDGDGGAMSDSVGGGDAPQAEEEEEEDGGRQGAELAGSAGRPATQSGAGGAGLYDGGSGPGPGQSIPLPRGSRRGSFSSEDVRLAMAVGENLRITTPSPAGPGSGPMAAAAAASDLGLSGGGGGGLVSPARRYVGLQVYNPGRELVIQRGEYRGVAVVPNL